MRLGTGTATTPTKLAPAMVQPLTLNTSSSSVLHCLAGVWHVPGLGSSEGTLFSLLGTACF